MLRDADYKNSLQVEINASSLLSRRLHTTWNLLKIRFVFLAAERKWRAKLEKYTHRQIHFEKFAKSGLIQADLSLPAQLVSLEYSYTSQKRKILYVVPFAYRPRQNYAPHQQFRKTFKGSEISRAQFFFNLSPGVPSRTGPLNFHARGLVRSRLFRILDRRRLIA